jgi:hypothetical protein
MARVELISSAYSGKSVIASGQECVNLYAEVNEGDPQAPTKVTYYLTSGSLLYARNTEYVFPARGCYRTSVGTAYYVVGQNVYVVGIDQTLTVIGIVADRPSQIKFKDNGLVVVLVDGVNGYVIDMASNNFGHIIDPNFYGADFVELVDTFFIFNRPDSNQFYISASNANFGMLLNSSIAAGTISTPGTLYTNGTYSNVPLTGGVGTGATANITVAGAVVTSVTLVNPGIGYVVGNVLSALAASIGGTGSGFAWTISTMASAFDPLDIAAKSGFNDPIIGITAVHRELQLIGNLTTEIWIGTGAADFYFQQVQGAFINHGCGAQYSIATIDVLTFFIMQDQQGNGQVVQLQAYDVTEISTPRIVQEFKSYATLEDAIGFCFQIDDHAFYALVFPTASKGWLYDLKSKQWCEWNYSDINGNMLRPRVNCCMFAFGFILAGDWQTGNLLRLDPNTYIDFTNDNVASPIIRLRTFPHMVSNNKKVSYNSFDADIEVGTIADDTEPMISLSWSDNKGVSYGNPVMQSMGKIGEFLTSPTWNKLGEARDRIFKLSWSENLKTALNGGFVETIKATK